MYLDMPPHTALFDLDLSIVNCFIPITSCTSKPSHQNFRLALVRDLQEKGKGCLNLKSPRRKHQPFPSANHPDTVNTGLQEKNKCDPWKGCDKIQMPEMKCGACVLIPASKCVNTTLYF
jgi:hypothetical protein